MISPKPVSGQSTEIEGSISTSPFLESFRIVDNAEG
jgi:hypothetical protein